MNTRERDFVRKPFDIENEEWRRSFAGFVRDGTYRLYHRNEQAKILSITFQVIFSFFPFYFVYANQQNFSKSV